MNDYEKNHDSMNNNYNGEYGAERGGEYSYNYTPDNTRDVNGAGLRKKKAKKYIFMSVVSVIVTAMVVFSVFSLGSMVVKYFLNNGAGLLRGVNGTVSNTSGQTTSNAGGDISIPKNPGNEQNGLTSAGALYNTVTEVYNAVSESVVEISTETVQNSGWMGQYVTTGAGSGVIIHSDGYIVTNHHVIDGANNVTVTLSDGTGFKASFVGTDESNDIAVIKIEPGDRELSVASLGCSNDLVVGEDVIAIGNPLGSLGGTVTDGIISATQRHISINGESMVLLQTTAAINPGNSGGGLFNMSGELIGIVNAKAAGDDVEGLGFAIPIDTAHPIIEDLINYGYVRGVVDHGIGTVNVTKENLYRFSQLYGIKETGTFVISSAYTDSLSAGDKIISVNGVGISSSNDINKALACCSVGDVVDVTVSRNGEKVTVQITLHEKVPDYVEFD